MSEEAAAPAETPAQETPKSEAAAPAEPQDWQAEATRLREELVKARKWEDRAKENSAAAKAAEKARLDAMSESERAIEEAKQSARQEATTAFGKRLATSEIRATAADAGADLAGVFDYLDLGRFVGEDGEPDTKAINAFVEGLPKKAPAPAPGLDLGQKPNVKPESTPGLGRLRDAYASNTK